MAAQLRWLNIVVDGTSALQPYWQRIVSDYLDKIVRCFCNNSQQQGDNLPNCQVGLVMYNANSDLGCEVQYIHWTSDVGYFLGTIASLAFNGDALNQYAMAEGLAEALVMYPRPSTEEYYNGKRHCILVAAGEPVPRKMLVSVPKIRDGKLYDTRLDSLKSDFLDVAQMFIPLDVSFSVITPGQHPIFGVIFGLGNNINGMENTPLSNYKLGEFTVMLSRNFKEARNALHGKRSVQPTKTTTKDITEFVSSQPLESQLVIQNSMDQTHVSSRKAYDDLEAMLTYDDVDQTISMEHIRAFEAGLEHAVNYTDFIGNSSNTSNNRMGSSEGQLQQQSAMNTTVQLGNVNEWDAQIAHGVLFGNSMFPNVMGDSVNIQFQPYSSTCLPMFPDASSSSTSQHVGGPSGSFSEQTTDFKKYVQTWEGTLEAIIRQNRKYSCRATAYTRATTPLTLTFLWESKLEISHFIPQKAVDHTKNISHVLADNMLFQIVQHENNDLHLHMVRRNSCAKIDLPSQILILSPTQTGYFYIGTVFPSDTVFVEPI